MVDFCKQCSIELFDKDYKELAGLISEEEVTQGKGALVICENCGYTLVDHNGQCLGGCILDHIPDPSEIPEAPPEEESPVEEPAPVL